MNSTKAEGTPTRLILHATGLMGLTVVVRSIANLLIVRFGLSQLGETAYGQFVVLQSMITYLNLSDLGVGQAIMNSQAATFIDNDSLIRKKILSSGIAVFTVIAITVWLAANSSIYFAPSLGAATHLEPNEFAFYFAVLSGLSLMTLPLNGYSASLGGLRFLKSRALWDITLNLGMTVLTLAYLKPTNNLLAILAAPLIFQWIWGWLPALFLAKQKPPITASVRTVDTSISKSLLGSSIFIFLMSVALLTTRFTGQFVSAHFISLAAVAVIHPHMILFQVFGWQLIDLSTRATLPFVTDLATRKQTDKLNFFSIMAAKLAAYLGLGFASFLLVFADGLLKLWLKKDIYLGATTIAALGFLFILDAPCFAYTNFSIALERHKVRSVANLAYSVVGIIGASAGCLLATEKLTGLLLGYVAAGIIFHLLVYPFVLKTDLGLRINQHWADIVVKPALALALLYGLKQLVVLKDQTFVLGLLAVLIWIITGTFLFSRIEKDWIRQRFIKRSSAKEAAS